MQQTYETLNGYKPKPFGAIEQRTLQSRPSPPLRRSKSPARVEAIRFLSDLAKLAQLFRRRHAAIHGRTIPPGRRGRPYAGIPMSKFESTCRAMYGRPRQPGRQRLGDGQEKSRAPFDLSASYATA